MKGGRGYITEFSSVRSSLSLFNLTNLDEDLSGFDKWKGTLAVEAKIEKGLIIS